MQICIAKKKKKEIKYIYLYYITYIKKESYIVTWECKCEEKRKNELNMKYFFIDYSRTLSSSDLSSDTTGGRLKVKNVNDI